MTFDDKNTAIDKALIILKLFAPGNRELGTTEVSKMLGFHRATVSRILLTLTRHGFLRQDPVRKTFTIGSAFIQISNAHEQYLKNNIIQIAKSHIDELSRKLNETVLLELLVDGGSTIMAYAMEGKRSVPFAAPTGGILGPAAAGAKIIYANLDSEPWLKAFEQGIPKKTKKTITSVTSYRKVLKETRQRGLGLDMGELDEKVASIAAAVFNHKNEPVASLNIVSGIEHIEKMLGTEKVEELKKTATQVSLELGWPGND